jgi:hypothetical protein
MRCKVRIAPKARETYRGNAVGRYFLEVNARIDRSWQRVQGESGGHHETNDPSGSRGRILIRRGSGIGTLWHLSDWRSHSDLGFFFVAAKDVIGQQTKARINCIAS